MDHSSVLTKMVSFLNSVLLFCFVAPVSPPTSKYGINLDRLPVGSRCILFNIIIMNSLRTIINNCVPIKTDQLHLIIQSYFVDSGFVIKSFVLSGPPRAAALYPLNSRTQGRDIGPRKNKPGRSRGVRLSPGPDGFPRGSFYFLGQRGSYTYFPNHGGIDTRNSITLLAWVYPESGGPIFNYRPRGSGVSLWVIRTRTLYAKFVRRSGKGAFVLRTRQALRPRMWNYIGASYDCKTGLATLWRESSPIAQRNIGRGLRLATNYPAVMGNKPGSRTYFRGRIACLQVFDVALNGLQMRKRRNVCFRGKEQTLEVLLAKNSSKFSQVIDICGGLQPASNCRSYLTANFAWTFRPARKDWLIRD